MKRIFALISLIALTSISKAQWTAVNNGLSNLNVRTIASDGTNIFTGTQGGGIFLSVNNGNNWTAVNTGLTDLNVTSIAIKGTTIFAGTQGGVFISSNNGTSWTAVNNGLTNLNVLALTVKGSSIFAGTQSGGVFLSTNDGASWTAINTGLPTGVSISEFAVNGTNLFAGDGLMGSTCGVYLTTNDSSWTAVNTGIFYICVQSLITSANYIFTGNIGSVYFSANNGNSWTAMNSGLPGSGYVSTLETDGTNVYAGWSGGGVYVTANNDTLWSDVSTGLPVGQYVAALEISGTNIFAGVGGMGGNGVFIRSLNELTGIKNQVSDESFFRIAPNPFNSQTTITFDTYQKNTRVIINDMLGKEVKSMLFTGQSFILEKNELSSGIFIIKIMKGDNRIITKKIVIE